LAVSIARCFTFIGPQLPRQQHFAIGNFIEDGLRGREIIVKAKHQVYRSYMHTDDLVRWLMTIASNSSELCPIYNVGSDEAKSILEIAKCVGEFFKVPISTMGISENNEDRYIPSIYKARKELGLELDINFTEAISRTSNTILNQINTYKYI
jgi:dTDP-glucose 4,6-dehydratase